MLSRIKRWYHGNTKIREFENDTRSSFVLMPTTDIEHHWSAKIARAVIMFYAQHWQWVWSTIIAVIALYVAILSLK